MKPCFGKLLELSKMAKKDGICVKTGILGNVDTLDNSMLQLMKRCKLDEFFISLDGLEKTNDEQRGKGCFRNAVNWMPRLTKAGINVKVKFTLTKNSLNDIGETMKLSYRLGAKNFIVGDLLLHDNKIQDYINSISLTDEDRKKAAGLLIKAVFEMTPEDNQKVLKDFLWLCKRWEFFQQMCKDQGIFINAEDPFRKDEIHGSELIRGVIWQDGSIYNRNKAPRELLGKWPEQSMEEIYEGVKRRNEEAK